MESYSNFSYFYIHPKDRIELYRAASDEVVLSEIRKAYAKVGWIVKFTKDESDGEVKVTVVEKESNE